MKYITLNVERDTDSRNPKISHISNECFLLIVLYVIVKKNI